MPQLKQIEASVEQGTSNTKLKEYGARYSDGHVETFIAVPDTDMPFSIHISTQGYIAPGISVFVFMDGQYQCNRNKIGFKLPGDGVQPHEYEAEFRMRQKEDKTGGGVFLAREWSFAKLNTGNPPAVQFMSLTDRATVKADKAPSLNPNFYSNVGTIEVVALRCRPASEESAPPRKTSSQAPKQVETAQKAASTASRAKSAKQPTPAPSKAPSKAASADKEDPLGGLIGLFDGACDSMGLDGANDERPAFDGPSGYKRPYVEDAQSATPRAGRASSVSTHTRLKRHVEDAVERLNAGQMDSRGNFLDERPSPSPHHQGDDLRGDRYLGMDGQDRLDYKQFFRERGDTVSQTPRPTFGATTTAEGFTCKTLAAAAQIQKAPDSVKHSTRFFLATQNNGFYENTPAGAQLLEYDLRAMRKDLEEQKRAHSEMDLSDEWRDWCLLEAQLKSMRAQGQQDQMQYAQPHVANQDFPTAREEALSDVHNLRKEVQAAAARYPKLDVNRLMSNLHGEESQIKRSTVFDELEHPDEGSALRQRNDQLVQQYRVLRKVLEALHAAAPHRRPGKIEDRANLIREKGVSVNQRIKELGIKSQGPQPQTPLAPTPSRHVNFQQGYDGSQWQQNAGPTTPVQQSTWNQHATPGQNADWAEVGHGTWGASRQSGNAWGVPKHASTHEHFPGQNLPKAGSKTGGQQSHGGWGTGAANANAWGGADQNKNDGQRSRASGNQGGQNGWNNAGQAGTWESNQQDNNADAGWGGTPSNQGGGSKRDTGSQRASQKGGQGNHWGNQSSQGGGWEAQSNKSQANNSGWGNNNQKSNASGSRSGGRDADRESLASNPTNFIKPYWKDWNKPATGSPDLGRRREVAREVYTYPAEKLPAIPEGKVSAATHGVQTGRGAEYSHHCNRPVYIDSMDKPYAVFSFKYRSKEKLKQITRLNVKTVDDDIKAVQNQMQKDKLMQMPKDQLIEQLMKSNERKNDSSKAPSAAGGQGWGDKTTSNVASKTKSAAGDGWRGNNNSNNNNDQWNGGGDVAWGGSQRSKSKKSGASGWAGNQAGEWNNNAGGGGGGGGWDGQDEADQDHVKSPGVQERKSAAHDAATPEGFKFDYEAFQNVLDAPSVADGPGDKNVGDGTRRTINKSLADDPAWS